MRPLVVLAVASFLGSLAWPLLRPEPVPVLLALAAACGVALVAARFRYVAGATLAGVGLLLGLALPGLLPLPLHLRGEVRLRGEVVTAGSGREADVAVGSLQGSDGTTWMPVQGRVRVRFRDPAPPPGSKVVVAGTAERPDTTYLAGAPDPAWGLVLARVDTLVRARATVVVGAPRPAPRLEGARHAGLLRAMVDGVRDGIPEAESGLLRRTGTWHVVSISGLHIGLVAAAASGVVGGLARGVGTLRGRGGTRVLASLAAIVAAWAFAWVAGMPVAARRAAWMTSVVAAGGMGSRRMGGPEVLALAWLAVTAAEPDACVDLGAQLSFGALVGMTLLEHRVLRWVPPDAPWIVRALASSLAATFGATLGTLPVAAWQFQQIAPTSPLANLWAVPLFGAIATPAVLLSQALPAPVAGWALALADGSVDLALRGLARVDAAPWHPAVGTLGAVALAGSLILRKRATAMLAAVGLILSLREAPRAFTVRFLAVGQGDAALVQWPDGTTWLIDGGPPGPHVLAALRRWGIRRLDTVVLSHPHPDHLGGLLRVAGEIPIGRVRVPRGPRAGEADFVEFLQRAGAPLDAGVLPRGEEKEGWGPAAGPGAGGVPLPAFLDTNRGVAGAYAPAPRAFSPPAFLHPRPGFQGPRDPVNDESLVVRVAYGGVRFLFAGDVEHAGEAALLHEDVRADVLKVAHHGSRTSSTPAFLTAVGARLAVISCGPENRYRHPAATTMEALARVGTRALRTDAEGTVVMTVDGSGLHVRAEGVPTQLEAGPTVPRRPLRIDLPVRGDPAPAAIVAAR